MPAQQLYSGETKYLTYPVTALTAGASADPTTASVSFAFHAAAATGTPAASAWYAGDWETDTSTDPTTHRARYLIGPDSPDALNLAAGDYVVWWRLDDIPENPAEPIGLLTVQPTDALDDTQLISVADIAQRLARDIPAEMLHAVSAAIDDLQGTLEAWLGRPVTVRTFTNTIPLAPPHYDGRRLFLPHTPVVSVTSADVDGSLLVDGTDYAVRSWGLDRLVLVPTATLGTLPTISVTCTAGLDPDDRRHRAVRGVLLDAACRETQKLLEGATTSGRVTIDGYSVLWPDQGHGGFLDSELARVGRFRRRRLMTAAGA